jgi:hypothetical protein
MLSTINSKYKFTLATILNTEDKASQEHLVKQAQAKLSQNLLKEALTFCKEKFRNDQVIHTSIMQY